jgi:hypothetical protein
VDRITWDMIGQGGARVRKGGQHMTGQDIAGQERTGQSNGSEGRAIQVYDTAGQR